MTRESLLRDPSVLHQQAGRPSRLQRRHTITICEAPLEHQVVPKELPVLQEEEEEQQQPSPIRDSLSGGSSSSIAQAGSAVLPRLSHSENDIQAHAAAAAATPMTSSLTVNLRQGSSLVRRASFEHRRSLTSQGSLGLTSIPEQEDDGKGGSDRLARAKNQEQCPPPNPSPPCKGRAKAGLAMVGMKSTGGPYHPRTHNKTQTAAVSAAPTAITITAAATLTTSPPRASMQHAPSAIALSSKPFGHDFQRSLHATSHSSTSLSRSLSSPFNSSTASASSSSSSSLSSSLPLPSFLPSTPEGFSYQYSSANLDISSSCQSPAYRKKFQSPGKGSGAMHAGNSGMEGSILCWQTPAPQYGNQGGQTSVSLTASTSCKNYNINSNKTIYSSPSVRRWAVNVSEVSILPGLEGGSEISTCDHHTLISGSGYYPEDLSSQQARLKRLSLDAGMSMYYEEALRENGPDSLPSSPHLGREPSINRKISVGLDRGLKARTGFRRMKTPEEEERVTRWRALQEDEREARQSCQQPTRRSGVTALTSPSSTISESTDVLQQKMAGEEERFDRWRRLEEGTDSHPSLKHRSSPDNPNMNPTLSVAPPHARNQKSDGAEPPHHHIFLSSPSQSVSDFTSVHDILPMPVSVFVYCTRQKFIWDFTSLR